MLKTVVLTVLVWLLISLTVEAQQFRSSYSGETPLDITSMDDTYEIFIDNRNVLVDSDCFNPICYIAMGEALITAKYIFIKENLQKFRTRYEYNLVTDKGCVKISESEGSGKPHIMSQLDDKLLVVNYNDIILMDENAEYVVKDISQYTNNYTRFEVVDKYILVSQGDAKKNGAYLNVFNKDLEPIAGFFSPGDIFQFTVFNEYIFYVNDDILCRREINGEGFVECGKIDPNYGMRQIISYSNEDEFIILFHNYQNFKLLKINSLGEILDSMEAPLLNHGRSQSVTFNNSLFEIDKRYKLFLK